MSRLLTISFGGPHSLAQIETVEQLTWDDFAARLAADPPETEDKASVGWFSCATYSPVYRHSDNLIGRDCLTLDYDRIEPADVRKIREAFKPYAHVLYTTWSHTNEKPRLRVVLPLSRLAGMDEFCAVSRAVAAWAGIELASGESHVPAQMMFMPAKKPGTHFKAAIHTGEGVVDVDAVLASYADWTDRSSWPRRAEGDSTHSAEDAVSPLDKPGIVGDFCRAFNVVQAIEKFDLPYKPTANPNRWTYAEGSRPEGVIVYDDATKIHSHHDTDPARGQHNAFDLVRLHRFARLDDGTDAGVPITERPSYRAMSELGRGLPEVHAAIAIEELDDLGPLPALEDTSPSGVADSLARRIADVLKSPTKPRWLLTDIIERGVIAVAAGPRGSYKSFITLDWAFNVALQGLSVYCVSAEGGDFDRRARAWMLKHAPDKKFEDVPLYVVERRLNLSTKEGVEVIRQDCVRLGIRPVLFVLDTYSKLSGGLDENDNSAVKQFIGLLDHGLKRADTGFDATVLLVAHTGLSDPGRPRGASALAADTDAEYIVAKSVDTVTVTRERFKSSPELPPLCYTTEIVPLGYEDDNGQPVTSVILRPSEAIPTRARARRSEPSTAAQKGGYVIAKKLLAAGPVNTETLITAIANSIAHDPSSGLRDQRRRDAKRTVNQLAGNGFLVINGTSVGLNNATVISASELADESKGADE